jgi:immunity protein, SdpI family
MKLSSGRLLGAALTAAAFGLSLAFYGRLPQLMPTHWNLRGVADGFTPKPWGPFILPLVMAGTFAVFFAIPLMSPRGFRIAPFARVFDIVQGAILAFLLYLHAIVLVAASGGHVDMERALTIGLGLLFAVLGNFMGKMTRNFFIGIRTPWTLASDEVWRRTHRFGGKLFVAGGFGIVISGLAGGGIGWMVGVMLTVAAVTVVHSYVVYRRIEGFRDDPT